MKKIVFYSDTPIYGGAEKQMLLLAQKITRDKYKIILVCSSYKQLNDWANDWKKNGFDVYRLNVAHKHDPRHLFQLRAILRKEKPDILHIHLWNPGACRYAFSTVDPKTTKIITTEHDPFPLSGLKNLLKKRFLKKTAYTIAVSDQNRDMLLKNYPQLKGKIKTIHNGIFLEKFDRELIHFSAQEKSRIKHNLFKANNEFIITSVAALHPRKGLDILVQAFAEVIKKKPNTKLIIAGRGIEQKQLEKLINNLNLLNKVVLLGFQENVAQILKCSDMFVLPSRKEAFGLVLLEAMAAQLPIIATNVGGIPEIIHSHKSGEIIEPENVKQLSDKILELMNNNALAQKLAFVARHEVKKFDANETARKTEQLYDEISRP